MLSDMLFSQTHNVEQIVDIKHKKTVDRVLLKVVKMVRERSSITDWIKPESDLRNDFSVTDRQMKSICNALGEFYNVYIDPNQVRTVGDIVGEIKVHQSRATDNMFLIDGGTDIDLDDDLEPKENLEVDPKTIEESKADEPEEKTDIPETAEVSTETTDSNESLILGTIAGLAAAGAYMYKAISDRKAAEKEAELAKEYKKQKKFFDDNYHVLCKYVRKNCMNDNFFTGKRDLIPLKQSIEAYKAIVERQKKIISMPLPKAKEDIVSYKNRLVNHFGGTLTTVKVPIKGQSLSIFEAGYMDANQVKTISDLATQWRKNRFTVHNLVTRSIGEAYKPALEQVGVITFNTGSGVTQEHKTWSYIWATQYLMITNNIFNHLKGKQKAIVAEAKAKEKPVQSKEEFNLLDWGIVGTGVVAIAYGIIKLYQAHKWDELVKYMSDNYEAVCKDIRENHKEDPAFIKNRAILYRASELNSTFAARINQLKKIKDMPTPAEDEDKEAYRAKLRAYFHPIMEPRVKLKEPSYLTLQEAGYLNAIVVKALISKIKEAFDLQDEVDQILITYMKKVKGIEFKPLMEEMRVADYFHALYKEPWSDHFSSNVMKAIVNGLKGESNKDVGAAEQLDPEPKKVEASMESIVPQEQQSDGWGDMLNSL